MKERPYFITWSKQSEVSTYTLLSANNERIETKEYGTLIDLSSISYHVSFGHNNPTITNSIIDQSKKFICASSKSEFQLKEDVSYQLLKLLKLNQGKIFYTVSGAESVENALKMARQVSKRKTIAALPNSYHGATLGALSITGDWRQKEHTLYDQYTLRLPLPKDDLKAELACQRIQEYGPEKIAAICLETVTGGNGVYFANPQWWKNIQNICRKHNIFLILDEVVCGFYRTGLAFGFHHYDLKPDFVCLSKSITGGHIPFGALWVSPEISKLFDHKTFSYGLTNYAHPLGLAATQGVLNLTRSKVWKENFSKALITFSQKLKRISQLQQVSELRSLGLLAGIELKNELKIEQFYKAGLSLVIKDNILILAPPTTITQSSLENSLETLHDLIKESSI